MLNSKMSSWRNDKEKIKTPTKITKISEEPKIFIERFWPDRKTLKFTCYYIEISKELINEPIGTEIWLDGYESGKRSNRPPNVVVRGNSPNNQAGYKDGLSTWHWENGDIFTRIMWKEGVPNGLEETFWENGQLKTRGNNGGPVTALDRSEGLSTGNGRCVGLWEFWDEKGNKINEKKFPTY